MWFKELVIKNVGPFADCSHTMTRGSIGVFGRNGRGKSTLLSLMYAIPTNDFGRFSGTKEECIRNTAGPKEESFVRGVIEHNGTVLDITRNLRATKARPGTVLRINGGEAITDSNKANAEINRLLNVDRTLLDLYAFKSQDQIYDFLATTPAARAKAYATLCRTEKCEKLWTMIGDYLNKDREVNVEIIDNSDELAADVAKLRAELGGLTEQIKQHQDDMLNEKSFATATAIVKKAERAIELRQQLSREEVRCEQLQSVDIEAAEKAKAAEKKLRLAERAKEEARPAAEQARTALASLEQYKAYRKQRKRLREEAEALKAEAGTKEVPQPPDDVAKRDEYSRASIQLEAEIDAAAKVVKMFASTQRTNCPTCGTAVENLLDHVAAMQALCDEGPVRQQTLTGRIAVIDKYKASAKRYQEWLFSYDLRVANNKSSLADLVEVKAPEGDEEALQQAVNAYQTAQAALVSFTQASTQADRHAHGTGVELAACRRRVEEIETALAETAETEERISKAKQRLEEHAGAKAAAAKLEGQSEGLRRQIEDKEGQVKALKHRLKRSKRVKTMAAIANRARDVLHRDALPRRVAQTNLSRMEEDINAGLGRFGDPFWVETSPDLTFTVHKPGEPPQPATFLSTGQRVILALSFWPAVAALWESDIGLLALDEPTANLDEENRRLLSQSLGAMTAKVRGRRQLVMVTHDHSLKTSFDQVIDLG